jgi:hypothetical protein
MKARFLLGVVLSLAGLTTLSVGARADSFSFQDWGVVEGPIYHWSGPSGSGTRLPNLSCSTGPDGEPCVLRLGTLTGATTVYNYVIYDSPTHISDLLTITAYANGGLVARFESDQDPDFGQDAQLLMAPGTPFTSLTELPNDQFVSPSFQVTGFTNGVVIGFRSDVEAVAVPEPGSLALFGAGLLGICGLGMRRLSAQRS